MDKQEISTYIETKGIRLVDCLNKLRPLVTENKIQNLLNFFEILKSELNVSERKIVPVLGFSIDYITELRGVNRQHIELRSLLKFNAKFRKSELKEEFFFTHEEFLTFASLVNGKALKVEGYTEEAIQQGFLSKIKYEKNLKTRAKYAQQYFQDVVDYLGIDAHSISMFIKGDNSCYSRIQESINGRKWFASDNGSVDVEFPYLLASSIFHDGKKSQNFALNLFGLEKECSSDELYNLTASGDIPVNIAIFQARIQKKLSIKNAAELLGVHVKTYSRIENGESEVLFDRVVNAISKHFFEKTSEKDISEIAFLLREKKLEKYDPKYLSDAKNFVTYYLINPNEAPKEGISPEKMVAELCNQIPVKYAHICDGIGYGFGGAMLSLYTERGVLPELRKLREISAGEDGYAANYKSKILIPLAKKIGVPDVDRKLFSDTIWQYSEKRRARDEFSGVKVAVAPKSAGSKVHD